MFPRIPERGIRGKSPGSILNFYVLFQTIVLHFALYVLLTLSPALAGSRGCPACPACPEPAEGSGAEGSSAEVKL
ncbi:hypothetical protein D3OALGA1CA_1205 [Olavius algarvensis associated proteobacterium Delta 3]|nr:hypothetical protein D3OALGA1CA_1205 [Olavius algarvensis associated proteobacterium Delta 3]CAB5107718.1 hypothetical protein D3OALGB2SA_2234 [Olavius algarvensis associated proteobacterium Delta 3]